MSGTISDYLMGWWNGTKPVSDAQKIQEWREAERIDLLWRIIQDKHDAEAELIAKGQEINRYQMTFEEHKLIERKKLWGLPLAYTAEVLVETIEGEKKPSERGDYGMWLQARQDYQRAKQQRQNTQLRLADAEGQSKVIQLDIAKLQSEICRLNTKVNITDE